MLNHQGFILAENCKEPVYKRFSLQVWEDGQKNMVHCKKILLV